MAKYTGMAKYTKLFWRCRATSQDTAVTPSGVSIARETFSTGLAWRSTAIAYTGQGTPRENYFDLINDVRPSYRNLVEVEGRALLLAERTLYKKYPELWYTPEAYKAWRNLLREISDF